MHFCAFISGSNHRHKFAVVCMVAGDIYGFCGYAVVVGMVVVGDRTAKQDR